MSLSEQILSLGDPTPITRDIDWYENDESSAKICNYTDEESNDQPSEEIGVKSLRRVITLGDSDPRYAGEVVSRKKWENEQKPIGINTADEITQSLNEEEYSSDGSESEDGASSEEDNEGEEFEGESGIKEDEAMSEDGHDEDDEQSADSGCEDDRNVLLSGVKHDGQYVDRNATDDFIMIPDVPTVGLKEGVAEDIEKGKAIKNQISVWDGVLEGRIRLHKVLPLINRLPQGTLMESFKHQGKDQVLDRLKHSHSELSKLLHTLLELQSQLLLANPSTRHVIDSDSKGGIMTHNDSEDEEIFSDSGDDDSGSHEDTPTMTDGSVKLGKRRRNASHWEEQPSEQYIEQIHERFKTFRNDTITKWNEKLKLSSGKMSSKAFLHFDRSVMTHINHVLQDKHRLRKRSQLKRTQYKVLGQSVAAAKRIDLEDKSESTTAVKDYDPEIFDDDDFYHQLLKELIDRKTSHRTTDDPIEMGRQWLELQKLRAKVKKKVDTKASKGRRLRYEVHQKLTNFMTPIDKGNVQNSARNDLFSSLFGLRSAMSSPYIKN